MTWAAAVGAFLDSLSLCVAYLAQKGGTIYQLQRGLTFSCPCLAIVQSLSFAVHPEVLFTACTTRDNV